jgi:hypothetical protein
MPINAYDLVTSTLCYRCETEAGKYQSLSFDQSVSICRLQG